VIEDMRPQIWQGGADDRTVVVADNEQATATAGKALHAAGLHIEQSPVSGIGEASDRACEFVQWLGRLHLPVTAAIGGGEYTVHVRGNGVGGRNTEFALAAALELDRLNIPDWTVASLATDGDDAMTEVAGAIVDSSSVRRMRELALDPDAALANNDSLAPLSAIGATLATGPTGTNVNDIYLAVRLPKV
jgi:hydroxypyruvate reductase